MYIKQVLIEGFKSYKELVQPEPFSPKVNCVVGANGSGKSNFFYAIRFVLSDLFQNNMRQEDRQSLLHEGTGGQVLSAFVEIVFDNTDNRFPVDKEEVRLRRTVGLRKDEYWLNLKSVTKNEVSNLLESAGFSRSNPYYVVQQGKIAQLSLMKDAERLTLLKEIGGARVYEERRKESLKTMLDAAARRQQIDDVVKHIEERLAELDAEKDELKEYQKLDKQRRAMEYTIFEKELHHCKEELDRIDVERKAAQQRATEEHDRAQKREEELREAEGNLGALSTEREGMEAEKRAAETARAEALKVLTRVELDAQELQEKIASDQVLKAQAEAELRDVQSGITDQSGRLQVVQQELDQAQRAEDQAAQSLGEKEKQLDALYQKQGRKSQFSSRRERNAWLQANIDSTQGVIQQKSQQVSALQADIAALREDVTAVEQQQQSKQQELQSVQGELRACQEAITEQETERNTLGVQRKKLMKEEAECSASHKRAQEEQRHANNEMDHHTPREIRRGLDTLKRIVRERNMEGVHGSLLELIDCDPIYQTAVEVSGGNNLYNVVVDNDDIAARLVGYLRQENGGRITFIPLNRATAPRLDYPDSEDVQPLLSVLRYNTSVAKACAQVFGRTVLCKDLDVAADIARSGQFDCITLEGSRVERRGAYTGGHYDAKRSKLMLMRTINEAGERLQELAERARRAALEAGQLDQQISGCLGELEKLRAQQSHLKGKAEQLRAEEKASRGDLAAKQQLITTKEKTADGITRSIEAAQAEVAEKAAEMASEFGVGLTGPEQDLMASLPAQIKSLKQGLLRAQQQRMGVEGAIQGITNALSENLVKRQDELQAQLDHLRIASGSTQAQSMDGDVRMAREAAAEASQDHKRVMDRMTQLDAEIGRLKLKRDELQRQDEENKRRMQDESKILEQLQNQKKVQEHRKEDLNCKVADLGVLPEDAFKKYKRHSLKELHRLLHRCNESLKKFSHVNKKALDQYASFTEQRSEMQKRQEELNKSDESIRSLIEHLDLKKDEALERTFKQVARNFRETFKELVPMGHGSLVMIRKKPEGDAMDEDDDGDEEGRREEPEGLVDKYSGVRVKVSFTGHGETQSMKQLSGGQKTVVALCLIFAIQRCDPAPFYLFDEIDAALDAQYRSAVARVIENQAEISCTQFILTTFRPELVKVADRLYSVEHRNRVSSVRVVNQEAALRFVETDQGAQAPVHNALQ